MNFNIISFGCKVNSYESEFMKEQLIKNGYLYSDDYKTSDIVIVNTCSVTNTADNKCKKMIRSICNTTSIYYNHITIFIIISLNNYPF